LQEVNKFRQKEYCFTEVCVYTFNIAQRQGWGLSRFFLSLRTSALFIFLRSGGELSTSMFSAIIIGRGFEILSFFADWLKNIWFAGNH
jgi:hypothetical protein